MNHNEAMQQMAVERYLLEEMTPEVRDAFEEHLFDCRECVLDLRATSAFVDEAKVQLPQIASSARLAPVALRPAEKRKQWFSWLSPAFAAPAFAVLVLILCYQNLATIPALRSAAAQPAVLPWTSVHIGTRGAAPIAVNADRRLGVVLLVDLPQQATFASYSFELLDAKGKPVWKNAVAAPAESANGTLSLLVPAQGLEPGAYTLAISGKQATGETAEIGRRALELNFAN